MKFSVIVPVYRTGEYLDRCVRSVLSQSCRDLELILVDDCSPDHCGRLCDEYAATDPRVRVIHKPVNEGLGFARNTGLEAAQGDFILFLDSDDWLDAGALRRCEDLTDEDILVFGTTLVHEKNNRQEVRLPQEAAAHTEKEKADVFAMLTRVRIFQFAWNKIYRRSFLTDTGIRFEQTKMIEDFLFNIALLPKAKYIRCIPHSLHFYRKPVHETMASSYTPDFFRLCKRKYTLEEQFIIRSDAPEHRQLICHSYVKHLISAALRNAAAGLTYGEQKLLLKEMLGDPVTVSVMDHYRPASPLFRLLKGWICNERIFLLLTGCRIYSLLKR